MGIYNSRSGGSGALHSAGATFQYWPLFVPVVGFLVFVYKNDGQIVLGDKEHHSGSTIHPAMLLHQIAAIFMCIFPLQILGYLLPYDTESSNSRERKKNCFRFKLSRVVKLIMDILFSMTFLLLLIVCCLILNRLHHLSVSSCHARPDST